ncbi:MAG: M42 family metallopeptidase [Clostridia bacterium]|nr:M42 family metallopeptidase [Clostridia bacterium]
MDYLKTKLHELMAIDSPTGFTESATDFVMKELEDLGYNPIKTLKGGVQCCLGGEGNPLIFSAHIDTLGGMVCEIKSNGRLKLTKLGGLQPNNIETENCRIYNRFGKVFTGCFQMNDPSVHVNNDYGTQARNFDNMEVVPDIVTSSRKETETMGISVGDIVCFDPRTVITESGYIKSRFLDDKLSVVILLQFAKMLKEENLKLKRKVYIYVTNYEEVGHGCSSALPEDAVEIVCVDMGCVGSQVQCTEHQVSICAKDSSGPSDYGVTTALIKAALEAGVDYAVDVYPYYGSDADAALHAGANLRHSLIGSGVYASHGYERTHLDGVRNTLSLIKAYTTEK